jgi:hypothetical protein
MGSVGIVTQYELDLGFMVQFLAGVENFLFSTVSRLPLGPIYPTGTWSSFSIRKAASA